MVLDVEAFVHLKGIVESNAVFLHKLLHSWCVVLSVPLPTTVLLFLILRLVDMLKCKEKNEASNYVW